jgi:hypothetical protein
MGSVSDAKTTHSICLACIAKIDAQIAALEHTKATTKPAPAPTHGLFPCAECPRDGYPYRIAPRGHIILIYLRCVGCGLEWTVEHLSVHPKTGTGA